MAKADNRSDMARPLHTSNTHHFDGGNFHPLSNLSADDDASPTEFEKRVRLKLPDENRDQRDHERLQVPVADIPRRDEQRFRRSAMKHMLADEIRVLADHPLFLVRAGDDLDVGRPISVWQVQAKCHCERSVKFRIQQLKITLSRHIRTNKEVPAGIASMPTQALSGYRGG